MGAGLPWERDGEAENGTGLSRGGSWMTAFSVLNRWAGNATDWDREFRGKRRAQRKKQFTLPQHFPPRVVTLVDMVCLLL